MKNRSGITVIIPAFNSESNIHSTLNSLLAQTDLDFEIIVIDDGSTDHTYQIVENILFNKFDNYRIIRQENAGVSASRNKGIAMANNQYLFFLDSDDLVEVNFIEIIKKNIIDTDAEIIAWGYNIVDTSNMLISEYSSKYIFIRREESGLQALS